MIADQKKAGLLMHSEFDKTFYPYYAMLTAAEQALYMEILPHIRKAESEIRPKTKVTLKNASNVLYAIYNDRPEIIAFMGGSSFKLVNDIVTSIQPNYNSCKDNLSACTSQLQKAVKSILKSVAGMGLLDKERFVHDYLIRNVSYVSSDLDQTAYAALVKKAAVCSGYTKAFQLLMQEMDIPCYFCSGDSYKTEGTAWGPHSWNIILLGGDFYNIDITWDDCYDTAPEERVAYTYFNRTDKDIAKNHKRSPECQRLPACNGTKYTFEKVSGVSPELALILQDGVTCKVPVKTKSEFTSLAKKQMQESKSRIIKFTFPTPSASVKDDSFSWFQEVGNKLFPYKNRNYKASITDYQNGWYRLEMELVLS